MKISGVRVHVLRSALEQPFAFSQGWVKTRAATLVEVSTDEGLVGWGEALCQGLQPPEIAAAAIQHALAPLAIGADPLEPEVLWHRMYHHTRDYGQKGALIGAIGALDIACWDIAGKARDEPVAQEDLEGYAEVRRALATPIAGGENEYTAFGFRRLFAARALDIAQPDLCIAGGFTACRHIVALAHAHGVQVNPHVWASAVGQAASLQFIASIPVANHSLFASDILLEFDTSSHPFREHLTDTPLRQRGGWVEITAKRRLGSELDRKALAKYSAKRARS